MLSYAQRTVEKLTMHINNLLEDLSDAHLALWRDAKRTQIVEQSKLLLEKVLRPISRSYNS